MNNIGGYCRKLSYTDPCDSISMVYVNNSCVEIVKPGDQCIYDLQCLSGSICTDGYCNCPQATTNITGYCIGSVLCNQDEIFLNNRCFKRVTLNELCFINQQCPNNAMCNYAARCVCPIGMMVCKWTMCQKTCSRYCIRRNKTKNCDTYQIYIDGECLDLAVPGEECINNMQCIAAASICHAGKF
ncbi:unnamed protein product [Wuchereria bancrofti]|uniref:EB domain-containing protein n=1 Tax=Wuchereria bancrofti TaxID=6293 RepID=A0A3P7FZR3_WUCBA|nr:unnamed protein product [Wuchereria bancrofti]